MRFETDISSLLVDQRHGREFVVLSINGKISKIFDGKVQLNWPLSKFWPVKCWTLGLLSWGSYMYDANPVNEECETGLSS